jgi:hypothetical protein
MNTKFDELAKGLAQSATRCAPSKIKVTRFSPKRRYLKWTDSTTRCGLPKNKS